MNSYRRNNEARASLIVATIAVAGVAMFIFSIDKLSGGLVRGYARQGGAALYAVTAAAGSVITDTGGLSTRVSLARENASLTETLRMRAEQDARFTELQEENERLRELVGLATSEDGIPVSVLSSFSSSPYGTFRIGGGALRGVSEGDLVLTPGGFVLGAVTFVTPRSATVEAFFAPGKQLEMQVRESPFVAEGRGGGNARGEIPRTAGATVGDVITIPAFEHRPAGIVGEVRSASSSPTATILMRTPVNLDSLRYVYVLQTQ